MFTVVITEKGGAQRRLQFDESEVTIGRVQGNDVVLPKGNVSKRHSRIVLKDNRFIVVDLKSTNGTYVNGRKITSPLVVKEGDKIYIGDFILTLEARSEDELAAEAPAAMKAPSALPPVLSEMDDEPTTGGPPAAAMRLSSDAAPVLPTKPPSPSGSRKPAATVDVPSAPPPAQGRARRTTTADANPPVMGAGEGLPARVTDQQLPPVLTRSNSSVPPGLRDDLRNVMDRLGQEFGAEPTRGSSGPERLAEAERAVEGAIGQMADQGALDAHADRELLKGAALREMVGTGPLMELLSDTTVQRIEVARYDRIYADRGKGASLVEAALFSSPRALDIALRRLAQLSGGASVDSASASFELEDGTHVAAIWPPLASSGPAAVLSRRPQKVRSLSELQGAGMLTASQSQTLKTAITARDNVLVVGPRSANITAVANALISQLDEGAGVLAIEPGAELGPRERVRIGLRWPKENLDELLAQANAFQVDRWVLHGAQSDHASSLLRALAARSDGSVCTLYAPSLDAALEDLRAHLTELGERAEPLLAAAFPVVVEVGRKAKETRVQHVSRLRIEGGRASAA